MKSRLALLALLLTLLGATTAVPMQAGAATRAAATVTATSMPTTNNTTPVNTLTAVPVTGTYGMGQGKKSGAFKGFIYVKSFASQSGGKLVALARISGVMTNPGGKVFKTVTNQDITLPISTITSNGSNSSGGASGSGMGPAGTSEARATVAGCQILNLNLGPLNLNLLGLVVNLNRVVLNITAVPGAGNLLGNLLCGVANLLNGGLNLGGLANLLNSILQILRPTSVNSPFANIPLVGTATGGAAARTLTGAAALQSLGARSGMAASTNSFVGLFTIKEFVKNTAGNGLLAKGTVTGVFGNGKNGTQDVSIPVTPTTGAGSSSTPTPGAMAPAAFPTQAMTSTAGCQILNLDLAPTNLNLLGLVVNLSAVRLNITAVPGAGALLGNLLCAVTNLLNGLKIGASTPANAAPRAAIERRAVRASSVDYDKLATNLTALANAYRGTISQPFAAIPMTGSARGHGTFTGLLDVQQFVQQNGKVMAVGVLSGVLSGAGSKSGIVQQSVMVPVSNGTSGSSTGSGAGTGVIAPQGLANGRVVAVSCPILHLNLGPLSLNLLGLVVNLNQVVLNITAVPGAGNLLGNLLCGVANLLNGFGGLLTLLNLFA